MFQGFRYYKWSPFTASLRHWTPGWPGCRAVESVSERCLKSFGAPKSSLKRSQIWYSNPIRLYTRSPTARFNSFHLLHTEMTLPHLSTTAPGTLDAWFVVTKDSLWTEFTPSKHPRIIDQAAKQQDIQQLEIFKFVEALPWTWHQNSHKKNKLNYSRVFAKTSPTPFNTLFGGFHLTDDFKFTQNNIKIQRVFILTSWNEIPSISIH